MTIPQSRLTPCQLRVAAKPSRPALRPAKASGCPTAAVTSSAAGGAPLRALYTREPWQYGGVKGYLQRLYPPPEAASRHGRAMRAPTTPIRKFCKKLPCAVPTPRSGAVRAALEKSPVAVTAIRFHWPARSREGGGSMERDSPVDSNGLGDASPWDARRAAPRESGCRSPRRVFGTFPR